MADEKKKKWFFRKLWESVANTVVLAPRALLATTTCAGQLLRNFLATDVNGGQSLKYKQSLKNYGKKLTYTLSAPVTAFSPKLKQKRGKLDKVPGPKERSKDMVRYDYYGRTIGRAAKYQPQLAIDAWLLWSEGIESMLYLDKESPMYTGPWPTIKQKGKNLFKSVVMPLEPLYRWSQNKLGRFGGKKKSESKSAEKSEKKEEPKKQEESKPIVKQEEKKPDEQSKKIEKSKENPHTESEKFEKAIKEKDNAFVDKELEERGYPTWGALNDTKKWSDTTKLKSIDELKNKQKAETQAKINADVEAKKWKNLSKEDKEKYKKDFEKLLENNITEDGVLTRAKKNKKGTNMEQVLKTLDKENPTFATFIDDEILAKKAPASAAS